MRSRRMILTPTMNAQAPSLPRVAYSIDEASAMLGISRWSTYQLLRRGELRTVRIGARHRIPAGELERLVRPQEQPA